MKRYRIAALLACAVPGAAPVAAAQPAVVAAPMAGTRLDLSVTGEVARVPDLATISTGVVTRGATASAALASNATRMARVRAALAKAGIAPRDIQTSSVNLNPDYTYVQNQPPRLNGYQASNQLSVRFRDLARAGPIIDALVAEGANQINGPTLVVDKPEAALDEARTRALAAGRARADLYARSLGMRVTRLLVVSEGQSFDRPQPFAGQMVRAESADAATVIEAGEQTPRLTLQMSFELQ